MPPLPAASLDQSGKLPPKPVSYRQVHSRTFRQEVQEMTAADAYSSPCVISSAHLTDR